MQNDGGIKRGDRADTGDNKVRRKEGVTRAGSGVRGTNDGPSGQPTADPSSLGAASSIIGTDGTAGTDPQGLSDDDLQGMNVTTAEDASLGLTNVGDRGPDDWAADTGPTRTAEGGSGVATADLADDGSTLAEDRSDHRNATAREDITDDPRFGRREQQ